MLVARRGKPNRLFVGAAVVLVAGAGCGGSTTPLNTGTKSHAPSAPGLTPRAEPTQTASPAEEARHEGPGTVPDETGVRLHVAEKNLEGRGITYKVARRRPADGTVTADWRVCETNPAPRSHIESGTTLRLIVAPSCP
jgi:hypothetical protein